MNKILLGTTALVTAGLVAGPALASDPLNVTISGQVITGFYVVDHDNAGVVEFDDTKVPLVARNIDINAEGTLDNGLVAGALLKLELGNDEGNAPQANNADFSEVYAYLEGGFGRLEVGATDGAAYKMHYTSPWFVPGNGVDSPNILNLNTTGITSRTSTFALLTEDDNKISYFTPRLGGFQLGVSYTPDTPINDPLPNGFGVSAENSSIEEVFEIAANYAGEFGDVEIGVDAFYVTGDAPVAVVGDDPTEYGFGANLGVMGFTLGGAWYQSEGLDAPGQNVPDGNEEKEVWTIGLAYGTGPWTVGVAYLQAESTDPGGPDDNRENDFLQFGGGYSLGSGVDIGLDIQLASGNSGAPGAPDVDSNSAGVVMAVAF